MKLDEYGVDYEKIFVARIFEYCIENDLSVRTGLIDDMKGFPNYIGLNDQAIKKYFDSNMLTDKTTRENFRDLLLGFVPDAKVVRLADYDKE